MTEQNCKDSGCGSKGSELNDDQLEEVAGGMRIASGAIRMTCDICGKTSCTCGASKARVNSNLA